MTPLRRAMSVALTLLLTATAVALTVATPASAAGLPASAPLALTAQPRIVAITANAMEVDRQRLLGAGMDAYLRKPVQLAELFAALDAVAVA